MMPQGQLIGESPGISAVREQVQRLARQVSSRRQPPVLIEGETGTGKGLVARLIHASGPRAERPFVDVNCAALPETLLEAELFGYERGAFTDARQAKPGLFQLAHGGTIFLDEIGLLSEGVQAKLLKVIEERSVRRLGGTRSEPIDVVVLSATNEDLATATRERRFRADLYHRLAVLTLTLPPLRERGGDILLLADQYLATISQDYGLPPRSLSPDARAALRRYAWPGNVRELRNVIERAALMAETPEITAAMLGLSLSPPSEPRGSSLPPMRSSSTPTPTHAAGVSRAPTSAERAALEEVLRETDWNISQAAARLGITRNTIRYRMEKHGLRVDPAATRRERSQPAAAPVLPAPAPSAAPIRWEPRRLTFLRGRFTASPDSLMVSTGRDTEVLIDKVQTFGGSIEEVGAGGVVAVFGLEPVEDAPRRAVKAAMAMQRAVARADGPAGSLTIVVHVAQAMIGRLADTAEVEEESRNRALEDLEALLERAGEDGIFVSEAGAPFLERRFDLSAIHGPAPPLYRLTGHERAGLGVSGHMARFVGRHHELQLLRTAFESAARGKGQVVGIAGDPGIGKSRLLFEFRQSIADRPVTCVEGHCLSYGGAIPYLPVLDILRAECGISDRDSRSTIAGKVSAALEEVTLDAPESAECLLHLLGLEGATSQALLDPHVMKARTFDTLIQLTLRQSHRTPLVVIIEDVHWSDAISREFFAALAEMLGGARILVILTYRPGYQAPWLAKSYAAQIALQPLAPAEGQVVLESLLPPERLRSLASTLLSKADGNPLFLEELCRAVLEEEDPDAPPTVPDTVEEVLLARIDRLPAREKHLLQAAAVIGRTVAFPVALAVAGLSVADLRDAFARLQGAEFLQERSLVPELEYGFKHGLTHETAYASLRGDERRALHAHLVPVLESLYPTRVSEHVEHLALHAFGGEMWEKAVQFCRQAGARAASRSANREAVAFFEQALAALGHLPERRHVLELALDLRFDLRNALQPLGELARIADDLRQAEALAIALGDPQRLGRVLAYLTDYWRLMGDRDRATEAGQRALDIADAHGDLPLQVAARTWLGQLAYAHAEYARAIGLFRRNVDALGGDLEEERLGLPQLPAVHSRTCLAWCLAEVGDFSEAIARGEEAMRLAESVQHPLTLAVASAGLGTALVRRGDFQRGISVLERALDLCRTGQIPLWIPRLASVLGSAYTITGRVAEARALLEDAVSRAQAMGLIQGRSLLLGSLGYATLIAGHATAARERANEALEVAREHDERGYEAWILRLLAEVALRSRPIRSHEGEARCQEARARAVELGMRPLVAHSDYGLAQIYQRTGQLEAAAASLAEASRLFAELGMEFWRARCDRARPRSA